MVLQTVRAGGEHRAIGGLVLLEACATHCGPVFHAVIGKFRFLNELIKLTSPPYNARVPTSVVLHAFGLFKRLAHGVERQPKIMEAFRSLEAAAGDLAAKASSVPAPAIAVSTGPGYAWAADAPEVAGSLSCSDAARNGVGAPQPARAAPVTNLLDLDFGDTAAADPAAASIGSAAGPGLDLFAAMAGASPLLASTGGTPSATAVSGSAMDDLLGLGPPGPTAASMPAAGAGLLDLFGAGNSAAAGPAATAPSHQAGAAPAGLIGASARAATAVAPLSESAGAGVWGGASPASFAGAAAATGADASAAAAGAGIDALASTIGATRLPSAGEPADAAFGVAAPGEPRAEPPQSPPLSPWQLEPEVIALREQQAAKPGANGGEGEEWELSRADLMLNKRIGDGNFGEVHIGKLKVPWGGTIDVAVKSTKADRMSKELFLDEANKLKQLQHRRLVRCWGLCTSEDPIFIVFEHMQHGSLLEFFKTRKGKGLGLRPTLQMVGDVAAGMAYIEDECWVHADLAARNLLVGDSLCVKICDFGHAVKTSRADEPVRLKQQLPVRWTSPEFYRTNSCSTKSDVWSFGVVIFELFTKGEKPYVPQVDFFIKGNKRLIALVEQGWRMARHRKVPEFIYAVQLDCWQKDRLHRPTFATLHSVFEMLLAIKGIKMAKTDLADGKGARLPPYRPTGPRYTILTEEAALQKVDRKKVVWTRHTPAP